MALSAQHMAEVVAQMRTRAERNATVEKRRTARMEVQCEVRIVPIVEGQPGAPFTILSRDLSQEGLGGYSARSIAMGSAYALCLPRNDHELLFLLAQATYCASMASGIFSTGFQFSRLMERSAAPAPPGGAGVGPGAGVGASAVQQRLRIAESVLG